MTARFCYVTAGSCDDAVRIGRVLVEERLAACANVLPAMTSIYRWQDQIEQASEAVLILKTRADLVDRLVERVKALHDYDCPCVVALPVDGGNQAFLDWIGDETG